MPRATYTPGAPATAGPLAAERVLDLSTDVAGAYCAKLLGDLGADVVKIEGPDGDPTRALGPFPPAGADPEAGALYLYLHTSRRSVVLDRASEAGRETLRRLVATHDIVVVDGTVADLARQGPTLDELHEWNPRAIVTTISGFGSEGPYAGYRSTHLITCALGGWASVCGLPGRPPVQAGGRLTETVSGAYAAAAVLGAVEGRARHGRGDHIDVSAWEAAITCAMGPTFNYELLDILETHHSDYMTGPSFNLPCKDGYVGINVLTERQWETLCLFVGRPDMADDPRFGGYFGRLDHIDEIRGALTEALADRTAEEIFTEGQDWRLPFGLVVSPSGALDLPAHGERGYLVEHEHPGVGTIRTPRVPFLMGATPAVPGRPPRLGEHTDEVLAELDAPAVPVTPARPGTATGTDAHPFAGLRVVDLTMFMSGPLVTLLAGDLGADVIKVEAVQRLDGWRGVGRLGERPWENSGMWNWINRMKRGVTLNLADPRGAELLAELVATADVVIENYTPRVMANFGLDYDQLRAVKPDLIMLSLPGFGSEGAWRDYAAFAWTTEQMSSICHLTGYPDSGPLFTGTTCGDPLAGLMGAMALFSAVNHRRRTGEGQHIDLSQTETATSFVGDALVAAQVTGTDPMRAANANPHMAPHGIYPCRDERWAAIACEDDEAWRALWTELDGEGALPYPTLAERLAAVDELDALLAAWTADRDADEIMHGLQARGIAAAAVMNGKHLLADRHLAQRGFFLVQDRAEIGETHYLSEPFRLRDAELPEPRRAAYLGEHNAEVLGGILGVSPERLAELDRDAVTGTAPLGFVRPDPARTTHRPAHTRARADVQEPA
ncbi:MAG: CoA transferase [Pseudonocardia sp.]|nr:CoA transferase [Pseudonocardia sp.]